MKVGSVSFTTILMRRFFGLLKRKGKSFHNLLRSKHQELMTNVKIGIIGGSGLYQMPELSDVEEIKVETPFGSPSDAFIVGRLEGERVAFLPRHGRGHRF